MKPTSLILDFEDGIHEELIDHDLRDGLSAACRTEQFLWLACDENVSIQRLERTAEGNYGKCKTFFLSDYIDLPEEKSEIDIEGMEFDGQYLWIVGSHSYVRKNIKPDKHTEEQAVDRLRKVSMGANRNLLLRIPCQKDENGAYSLYKTYALKDDQATVLSAAKLKLKKKASELRKKLKDDIHLSPFLKIPGKDNGFDIEGLTLLEDRIFLGLRGPVLRGWAIILEVNVYLDEDGNMRLKKSDHTQQYFIKHFLDLQGMGVRELAREGNNLLILAGPTMDLDGSMAIYRWNGACGQSPHQLIKQSDIERIIDIPFRSGDRGINKAEGMVCMDEGILVVYDSPGKSRKLGKWAVKADLFSQTSKSQ